MAHGERAARRSKERWGKRTGAGTTVSHRAGYNRWAKRRYAKQERQEAKRAHEIEVCMSFGNTKEECE